MSLITDQDDVEITYMNFSQEESTDSAVFVLKVPCKSGQWLKADTNPDVTILGREHGTADAFVDLNTNPISLDPYDGTSQAFDLKLSTGDITGMVSTAIDLRATFDP